MKILMIGAGYVGLVTAACLSEMGNCIICFDIDEQKIEQLNRDIIPIYEPGLKELIKRNKRAGRLHFSSDFPSALKQSLTCFICVPTPSQEDGSANLSYVLSVANEIATHMDDYKIIVNRSTSPVGTSSQIRSLIEDTLKKRKKNIPFDVVSQPEFLKEGAAIQDCMKPDRIIIGSDSPRAIDTLKKIYSAFTFNHDRILIMDVLSAEMTKYAANAMLATRISFMNELAFLCEKLGANIHNVRIGMGSDARIGYQYLYAGTGFGGSCLPKDLRAFQAMFKKVGGEAKLLKAVQEINEKQKKFIYEKIKNYFYFKTESLKEKTIALWGLSFKPETDDIRDAPSIALIEELYSEGAFLRLYDPVSLKKMKELLKGYKKITFCKDEYHAAQGADAICLMTEWKQFRFIDFEKVRTLMKGKAFFDGRNQYKSEEMQLLGFDYFGIGLPSKEHAKQYANA